MAQVLAMQNRLFERMVQNTENLGAALLNNAGQAQSKLGEVQRAHRRLILWTPMIGSVTSKAS